MRLAFTGGICHIVCGALVRLVRRQAAGAPLFAAARRLFFFLESGMAYGLPSRPLADVPLVVRGDAPLGHWGEASCRAPIQWSGGTRVACFDQSAGDDAKPRIGNQVMRSVYSFLPPEIELRPLVS